MPHLSVIIAWMLVIALIIYLVQASSISNAQLRSSVTHALGQ